MIVKIIDKNGNKQFDINGKIHETSAFRTFRPDKKNISQFYNAGVRLMSILCTGMNCTLGVPYSHFGESWIGEYKYYFAAIDNQIDMFIANAPEAFFNIMLMLDTREWYLNKYPEAIDTYWELEEMTTDEHWRKEASDYLTNAVLHIEKKYGDRVFAYTLMCGNSTEWYTTGGYSRDSVSEYSGLINHGRKKLIDFQEYMHDKNALPPKSRMSGVYEEGAFKDPVENKTEIEYWKFHNRRISELILYFADKMQQVIAHKKLVGLFFGYIMKPDLEQMTRGILDYERVWKSKNIDMIYAPAVYEDARKFEGTSGFLLTVDSLALNNKLYYHEMDHRTYLAKGLVDGVYIESLVKNKLKTEDESIAVLRREFAMCQAKRVSFWWFDFFGGYYDSDNMMRAVDSMVKIDKRLRQEEMHSISEIAVFYDTESLYFISQDCGLANEQLMKNRDALNRIGAPYDIFNFTCIKNVDLRQYKLIIFANECFISDEYHDYIKNAVKNGGRALLWMYAPGIIDGTILNYSNISVITDIGITKTGYNKKGWPEFVCDDKNAVMLEEHKIYYKRMRGYSSFYCCAPSLTAKQFMNVAKMAGVHIYNDEELAFFANNKVIGIHNPGGGETVINLPDYITCSEAEDLFEGGYLPIEAGKLVVNTETSLMKLFLLI